MGLKGFFAYDTTKGNIYLFVALSISIFYFLICPFGLSCRIKEPTLGVVYFFIFLPFYLFLLIPTNTGVLISIAFLFLHVYFLSCLLAVVYKRIRKI